MIDIHGGIRDKIGTVPHQCTDLDFRRNILLFGRDVDPDDEILPLKEMERRHLLKAMQRYNYNQKLVAKKLGIGYTTLWRKLKEAEKDYNSSP